LLLSAGRSAEHHRRDGFYVRNGGGLALVAEVRRASPQGGCSLVRLRADRVGRSVEVLPWDSAAMPLQWRCGAL
jgi:hypothetical protein